MTQLIIGKDSRLSVYFTNTLIQTDFNIILEKILNLFNASWTIDVQNEAILQPRSARAGFLAPPFSEAHPAAPLPPRSLRQTAEGRGLPNTLSNPVGLCVRL